MGSERAKKIGKSLLAVVIAVLAGGLLVAGVLYNVASSSRCDGMSAAEIARLEKPDAVVTLKELDGRVRAALNEGEKAQLLDLFRRDLEGWAKPVGSAPALTAILAFDGTGVFPVGMGPGFMARGACHRTLSALDLNTLQSILR